MRKLNSIVGFTIIFLIVSAQLCAQEKLNGMTFLKGQPNQVLYSYIYEGDRLTAVNAVDGQDSASLEIVYASGNQYKSIRSKSSTNDNWDYSLNFRYNKLTKLIDSVYFVDKNWIGIFTFEYDSQDNITSIRKYVNHEGELKLAHNLMHEYDDFLIDKRRDREFYSFDNSDDYGDDVDFFTYDLEGKVISITHYFDSSNGHSSTEYQYTDDLLVSKVTSYYDGGDDLVSQNTCDITYFNDKTYDDILHPFRELELLQKLGFPRYSLGINYHYVTNELIYEINSNDGNVITLGYDIALPIEEEPKIDISAIIYPNPVTDYLRFTTNFDAEEVVIYSVAGELICKMNYKDENINLVNLQDGNYILTAYNSLGESVQVQFIKI